MKKILWNISARRDIACNVSSIGKRLLSFLFAIILSLPPFTSQILLSSASYNSTADVKNESLKNKKVPYKEIRERKHSKNKSNLKKQSSLGIPADGVILYLDAMNIDGNNSFGSPSSTLSTWSDLSGNGYTGTLMNISLPGTATSGWTGSNTLLSDPSALRFDGTDDFVDLGRGASVKGLSAYTISSWFKLATLPGGMVYSIYWESKGDNNNYVRTRTIVEDMSYSSYSNTFTFRFRDTDSGTPINVSTGNNTITTGVWYHAVAVYDAVNSVQKIYLNGNLAVSASNIVSPVGNLPPADTNKIGAAGVPVAEYCSGCSISNVRVYNRALSADEVTQSYLSEKDYYLSLVSSNKVLDLDASNYDNAGTTASSSTSTMTWTDRSGNANNGTLTNFTLPTAGSASGWDGANIISNPSVLKFDGVDDYVEVADANSLDFGANDFTYSFWANLSNFNQNISLLDYRDSNKIFAFYYVGTTSPKYWELRIRDESSNWIIESFNRGIWRFTHSNSLWYHVALVRDTNVYKVYINGVPLPDSFTDTDAVPDFTVARRIGAGYGGSALSNINGKLANVRMYSAALTASQIQQNYLAEAGKFNNAPLKPAIASASRSSSSQVNQDTLTFTADYNETLTVNFACQDPDPTDTATLSTITTPQVGTFTASSASNPTTATYTYTPSASYINMNYSFSVRCTDSRGTVSPPLNLLVKGPDRYPYAAPAAVAPPASQPILPAFPEANSVQTINATPTATPVQNTTNTNNGSITNSQGTTVFAPSINTAPTTNVTRPNVGVIDASIGGIVKPKVTGIDISTYKPQTPLNVKPDSAKPYIDVSKGEVKSRK